MKASAIEFKETSSDPSEILLEMGTPGLSGSRKDLKIPSRVNMEVRKRQIARLEENIGILRRKQEDFHRKMEEYITSLRKLIANLQRGVDAEEKKRSGDRAVEERPHGTHVRCVGCGSEREFPDVQVLFAREPEDFMSRPTEVVIQDHGNLKKGVFRCPRCGDCNLTIRAL